MPSAGKRLMRATWARLPPTAATYRLAKLLTRTVLRPEGASAIVDVCCAGRLTLRVDLADIVGNDVYCMGDHYEAETLALWPVLARDAETILDLGSHVGLFACAAAAVNPHAKILAVEAFHGHAPLLGVNAARFANVTPVELAIGVRTGVGTFRLSPIAGGGYLEDAGSGESPRTRRRTGRSLAVPTVTLAGLCERHSVGAVSLMKLDLEGLEHPLLTGQDEFWSRRSPEHVIAEIATARSSGAADPIFDAMARRGYRWRRLEGLYTVPWFRREDLANWHFWKST